MRISECREQWRRRHQREIGLDLCDTDVCTYSDSMDPAAVDLWFSEVDQDGSGTITAKDLQQALVNSDWSHFNEDTCKLIMGMFDQDQSGSIQLPEFRALWAYIQQWRGIFDHFDADRSGGISASELTVALQQMGYQMSAEFSEVIIKKFDQVDKQRLTLDNFIQACLKLKSITDVFKQSDANMEGVIKVSYEQFVTMVLTLV